LRVNISKELHQNHIGIVKMRSIARERVWWPKKDKDIEKIAALIKTYLKTFFG